MKIHSYLLLSFLSLVSAVNAQLILDADGPGGTYDLISSKLSPGYDPVEVSDCDHTSFGNHNVFRFHIHRAEDSDRCIKFDRQRSEIKTYNQSPDSLLGVEGENVEYKWKFKLDAGFQSSPSFTHIHQLKSVGGTESSIPLITLTTRHGSPDKLELRYAENLTQVTLLKTDLTPFKDTWVEVTETVDYGESGTYSITINKVSDGSVLFTYTNNDLRMWKTGADFIRPKWGIYRSLNNETYLRDEEVLYNNFSIQEITISLPVELTAFKARRVANKVRLNWQTATEENNKGFEIHRSRDGRNWELIGFINGKGNSNIITNYTFQDHQNLSGEVYYRLKQIDHDGQFDFSDTVVLSKVSSKDIHLFPNPTDGEINIYGIDQDCLVELYDITGQKVLSTNSNDYKLDLSSFDQGTYFLKIMIGEKFVVKKIIR